MFMKIFVRNSNIKFKFRFLRSHISHMLAFQKAEIAFDKILAER